MGLGLGLGLGLLVVAVGSIAVVTAALHDFAHAEHRKFLGGSHIRELIVGVADNAVRVGVLLFNPSIGKTEKLLTHGELFEVFVVLAVSCKEVQELHVLFN